MLAAKSSLETNVLGDSWLLGKSAPVFCLPSFTSEKETIADQSVGSDSKGHSNAGAVPDSTATPYPHTLGDFLAPVASPMNLGLRC